MGPFDALGRTVNEQIADRSVRRALLLERLKNMHVREVVGLLNDDVFPELLARVESRLDRLRLRGFGSGALDTQRYQDVLDAIDAEIAAGMKAARETATDLLKASALQEVESVVGAVAQSMPSSINFVFDAPSPATLRALVTEHPIRGRTLGEWFETLEQDTQARLSAEVTKGIVEGQTTPQIAARLRGTPELAGSDGVLEVTRRQAETLVRTATTDVATLARDQTFGENADLLKGVAWLATLDDRTCPVCGSRDGVVYPVGEGPRPAAHPNCMPAGVIVSSPTALRAASRRWFDGEVIVLRTASGQKLAVTPNHPVLTPAGWLPAKLVHVGAYLIRQRFGDARVRTRDVNDQDVPARVEQVAESILRARDVVAVPVPVSAEDFHGDGTPGQIAVVGANRGLRSTLDAARSQQSSEDPLVRARVQLQSLTGRCTCALRGERRLASAGRSMRGSRERLALLERAVRHSLSHRGRSVPWFDSFDSQRAHDRRSREPMLERDALHADAAGEPRGDLLRRDVSVQAVAQAQAQRGRASRDGSGADAELARHLLSGAAGRVQPDQVIAVDVQSFHGFVFNIETAGNWYLSAELVSHNCRCTMTPVLKSWRELGIKGLKDLAPSTRASMNGQVPDSLRYGDWLKTQPLAIQQEALGVARARAFRAGDLTLGDFVDERRGRILTLDQLRELEFAI